MNDPRLIDVAKQAWRQVASQIQSSPVLPLDPQAAFVCGFLLGWDALQTTLKADIEEKIDSSLSYFLDPI